MKVRHVTRWLTTRGGGVSLAVCELARSLAELGITTVVDGIEDSEEIIQGWGHACVQSHLQTSRFPLARSRALADCLRNDPSDLLHTHGLWTDCSIAVARGARFQQSPWVVSPHGMLDPWALANSRWKKKIASVLFERRHLKGAACIHALCESERESIRAYGVARSVAVIPNGVSLPNLETSATPADAIPSGHVLLFLGRLHPKKGLRELLSAWHLLQRDPWPSALVSDWHLVIAGWDQGGHLQELKEHCRSLNIQSEELTVAGYLDQARDPNVRRAAKVFFVGPAFGLEKDRLLRNASAFVLPSFSEGLPIAVLEAWAYARPVAMTHECNIPEGFHAEAAIRLEHSTRRADSPHPNSLSEGLRLLMEMSDTELLTMGTRGRQLVEQRFTWTRIAEEYQSLYTWILGGGPPPACVS